MVKPLNESSQSERLTLATWLRFMIGRRDAIEAVAKSRDALWVGLLFVLSAGLAREYDGEYLVREPWHLLLPLAASLATSFLLYALVYWAAQHHNVSQLRWWAGYCTFLTFYWMTAPLACLYALPVERFLDPGPATLTNFGLLAVVSAWRVLLITRVISVWLNTGFLRVLLIVLFFGITVLLAANFATPTPVWDIMGGIRLPDREAVILNFKLLVWFWGSIAWFILLIAAGIASFGNKLPWQVGELPKPFESATTWTMWGFAILLIVAGLGLLPLAQPEQARRWQAEHLLHSGQIDAAIEYMAATPRDKFPPHWDPPPRTSYGSDEPPLAEVAAELNRRADIPAWVRDVYLEKTMTARSAWWDAIENAAKGKTEKLDSLLAFLERTRAPISGRDDAYHWLESAIRNEKLDGALRERTRRLLGLRDEETR
jgi:hypothetical protein